MQLQIEYVPIDSIKPYERNAKKHPKEQIEQIKKSIQDYQMRDPIGVWHNVIVEGHGRWIACKELGIETIPIIRLDDMTDEQRREYILVHNKTNMNSGYDFAVLDEELKDLPDFDAESFGFFIAEYDIDSFFTETEEKPENGMETEKSSDNNRIQCPHCGKWFEQK